MKTALLVLGALALGALAIFALDHAIGGDSLPRAKTALMAIKPARIVLAIALTALSYLLLTSYDALALRYAEKPMPPGTTILTSFIAYAFAHLPASLSSVSLLVQPVMAAIFAWLIFGEAIGFAQYLGGAIVLAGIWLARRGSTN